MTLFRYASNCLALSLFTAAISLFGQPSSTKAADEPPKPASIVVNATGGAMGKAQRVAFYSEFEKRYGIRVIDSSPADLSKLRAMVESGNVQWDVTEIPGQEGLLAKKLGLLQPFDRKIVDLSHFPDEYKDNEHLYPFILYSTVLGYRKDAFPNDSHPKGWADFWDVKRFPGRRSLRNHPVDNLEFALLADGVKRENLYPLDLDRAFRKLDEIKPHVSVWWTTGAQPAQLLIDKEVVLASGWNGRFYDIIKAGAPIEIEWTGGSMKVTTFGIPKGVKHPYWSQKFLAVMAEPKQQAIFTNILGYPGLDFESIKYVDPKITPYLVSNPDHYAKQFRISDEWWLENGPAAMQRWQRWMLDR